MTGKAKGRRRANNKSSDQPDSFGNVESVTDSESKENIPDVLTSLTLPGSSNKGKRDRRAHSKDEILDCVTLPSIPNRRETFVVAKAEGNVLEEVPGESNKDVKPMRKERRRKRNNSSIDQVPETLTISPDREPEEPAKKAAAVGSRRQGRNKSSTDEDEVAALRVTSDLPVSELHKKSKRKGRSKNQNTSPQINSDDTEMQNDMRGTNVNAKTEDNVVEDVPDEGNQKEIKPSKKERGRKKKNASSDDVNETHTTSPNKRPEEPAKKVGRQARNGRSKSQTEELPQDGPENQNDKRGTSEAKIESNVLKEVPEEGNQMETKPRKQRGKKRNNASADKLPETLPISSDKQLEEPVKKVGRQARSGRTKSQTEEFPQGSSENQNDRRGTFVISKTEDNVPEEVPDEGNQMEAKPTRKQRGRKRNDASIDKIPEVLTISSDEAKEPVKKVAGGRARRQGRKKSNEDEVPDDQTSTELPASHSPKKSKRKGRSQNQNTSPQTNDESHVMQTKRSSFVVSDDKSTELSVEEVQTSETSVNKTPGSFNISSEAISSLNDGAFRPDLPVGEVPSGERRGTFSISKANSSETDSTGNFSSIDSSMLKSSGKKRKRSGSMADLSVKDRSTNLPPSSPKVSSAKRVKSVVAPVTAFNKSVYFITPERSSKRTPGQIKITLTPHPAKKSISTPLMKSKCVSTPELKKTISTPLSVKKTPGQFSARKMPNFAKIHQKQFDKMESLVKYTERKTSMKEFFSSLNKTFTGLSCSKERLKSNRGASASPSDRKAIKSLIPVRRTVRFSDKDAVRSLANKTRLVPMNSIRERERDIIKGVRANKRFLLQMKIRKIT